MLYFQKIIVIIHVKKFGISFSTKTENIAVVVKAEHHCMTVRGVREHESDMTTAIMHGAFSKDQALKQEFYDVCLSMKGHSGN